ncbi:hypothetical protein JTB14_026608 [Gonioctena quinquepunctata]|nr:hypothetical protein JTB14_026608 [Gonioctena quinquepunctata]
MPTQECRVLLILVSHRSRSFRTFTFHIGKVPDENCIYCGEIDSPSHTIFKCIRWNRERIEFQLDYEGRIDAGNITRENKGIMEKKRKRSDSSSKIKRKVERQARL